MRLRSTGSCAAVRWRFGESRDAIRLVGMGLIRCVGVGGDEGELQNYMRRRIYLAGYFTGEAAGRIAAGR